MKTFEYRRNDEGELFKKKTWSKMKLSETQWENKAGYTAQDAYFSPSKITRDQRTEGPTDGRTDRRTDGHNLL